MILLLLGAAHGGGKLEIDLAIVIAFLFAMPLSWL